MSIHGIKYLKIIGLALCMPLMACEASDVSYVTKASLSSDPLYMTGRSDMTKVKVTNYGAIKVQKLDDSDNEGSLYVLQKKQGVYQAESMFKADKNKKYYFSVGMDYKNQIPKVGLRIEF